MIIEAYKLDVWDKLIERVSISVPSIIAQDEALFFSREYQQIPTPINLQALSKTNRIQIVEATLQEIQGIQSVFDRVFIEQIHPGEAEALAILHSRENFDHHVCTSDSMAIRAIAMLDRSHLAISFEQCLAQNGLQKPLEVQFKKEFFRENLKIGQTMRITGEGLAMK